MIFNALPLYAMFTLFGKRTTYMKTGALTSVDSKGKTNICYPEDQVFIKNEPIPKYMVAEDLRMPPHTEVLVMHRNEYMTLQKAKDQYGRLVHVHVA